MKSLFAVLILMWSTRVALADEKYWCLDEASSGVHRFVCVTCLTSGNPCPA